MLQGPKSRKNLRNPKRKSITRKEKVSIKNEMILKNFSMVFLPLTTKGDNKAPMKNYSSEFLICVGTAKPRLLAPLYFNYPALDCFPTNSTSWCKLSFDFLLFLLNTWFSAKTYYQPTRLNSLCVCFFLHVSMQ